MSPGRWVAPTLGVFDIAGWRAHLQEVARLRNAEGRSRDGSTAAANDNIYEVTVQAMDSTGKTGEEMVTVEVTNVDEPGNGNPVGVAAAGWNRVDRYA